MNDGPGVASTTPALSPGPTGGPSPQVRRLLNGAALLGSLGIFYGLVQPWIIFRGDSLWGGDQYPVPGYMLVFGGLGNAVMFSIALIPFMALVLLITALVALSNPHSARTVGRVGIIASLLVLGATFFSFNAYPDALSKILQNLLGGSFQYTGDMFSPDMQRELVAQLDADANIPRLLRSWMDEGPGFSLTLFCAVVTGLVGFMNNRLPHSVAHVLQQSSAQPPPAPQYGGNPANHARGPYQVPAGYQPPPPAYPQMPQGYQGPPSYPQPGPGYPPLAGLQPGPGYPPPSGPQPGPGPAPYYPPQAPGSYAGSAMGQYSPLPPSQPSGQPGYGPPGGVTAHLPAYVPPAAPSAPTSQLPVISPVADQPAPVSLSAMAPVVDQHEAANLPVDQESDSLELAPPAEQEQTAGERIAPELPGADKALPVTTAPDMRN